MDNAHMEADYRIRISRSLPQTAACSNSHYDADPLLTFCVSGILPRLFAARKPLPHDNFTKMRIAERDGELGRKRRNYFCRPGWKNVEEFGKQQKG